jgi:hypothetical protein
MDQAVRTADHTIPSTRPESLIDEQDLWAIRIWNWVKRHVVFLATVLVPATTAIVYYGLIASGVYISESRFVVRSPQKPEQASGFLSNLLEGTGISRSQDDTYLVHDFILSRDAVTELTPKLVSASPLRVAASTGSTAFRAWVSPTASRISISTTGNM